MGARAVSGRTMAESTPAFSPLPRPPAGAPHVVLIVLDDLGFAQLGCFGSDIDTPAIDAIAAGGLRYNRFHVTSLCARRRARVCSPGATTTRSGMGFLTDIPIGLPGYDARIPRSAGTLPRILRDARLQHVRRRQVASRAALGAERVGAVRPLAARPRLRALLRLPQRRHQSMDAGAGARQRLHRAAGHAGERLPPDRGSRRRRPSA